MKKEKSKNLIVIIGNGFDLAHGLKTSFNNFANYYLEEAIYNEILNFEGDSRLLSATFIKRLNKYEHIRYQISEGINEEKELDNFVFDCKRKRKDLILKYLKDNNNMLGHIISNSFLANLYTDKYLNWFNIEQAYYEELKKISSSEKNTNQTKQLLLKLNNELKEIEYAFHDYIFLKIKPEINEDVFSSFKIHFKERNQVCFINFNYTYTINQYINKFKIDNTNINTQRLNNIHIHGEMQTDIIIGYGDDTDESYNIMKDSKEKEYLRYFKTFKYLIKSEYREMLNELAVCKDYDVLIIGHSLDTTDKTVLKTILDTPKCNNIELLRRSDLNDIEEEVEYHFELHANLSRVFDSEADLRNKVIPMLRSVNFPIMTTEDNSIILQREKELYLTPTSAPVV